MKVYVKDNTSSNCTLLHEFESPAHGRWLETSATASTEDDVLISGYEIRRIVFHEDWATVYVRPKAVGNGKD
jgi:hypothetical protein